MHSIVRKGNRAVFDMDDNCQDVACIENRQDTQRMWVRVDKGVYGLDVLAGPPSKTRRYGGTQGFPRQGAKP